MAQRWDNEKGMWVDDEEDSSNPASSTIGFSGAPDLGTQLYGTGQPTSSTFNPASLPSGYQWGEEGYTRKYKDPYDITYDLMDASGNSAGIGYDSYDDAIRKKAFTSGLSYSDATPGTPGDWLGQGGTSGTVGGWTHKAFAPQTQNPIGGLGSLVDETGAPIGGTSGVAPTYSTKEELYNALMAAPGSPLTLDARTKYGSALPIVDQQRNEVLGQYLTGVGAAEVPDFTYHRNGGGNNIADEIRGENTLYGSTPLIRINPTTGKPEIVGRKLDLSPEEIHYSDKKGAVTGSSNLYRSYNEGADKSLQRIDDKYGYLSEDKVKDFAGWKNVDDYFYDKQKSNGFGSFLKIALPVALMAAGGLGAAGLFGEAAGAAGGLTAGEMAAATGFSDLASMGAAGGAWGGFGATAGGLGSLADAASNFGWSDAATSGMNAAFDGFGAGASNFSSGLSSLFDTVGANPNAFAPDYSALEAFNGSNSLIPDASALTPPSEIFGPPQITDMPGQYLDDWGGGTNSMGEFTNAKGQLSVPDRISTALRQLGMERNTAANLSQGGTKMFNMLTEPMGGKRPGMFQAPSPLNTLFRVGGALDSVASNKSAMDMYKKQMALASSGADPNRERGIVANDLWEQNWKDPQAGMAEFMGGAGRKFIDQARAQAAAGGKRGSYINSGKINSDLASLYLQNQNARGNALSQGFERPVNTQAQILQSMGPLLSMERNKYSPLWQVAGDYATKDNLSSLFDTVKGWF